MFLKKKKIASPLLAFIKLKHTHSYRVLIKFKKIHKDFDKIILKLGGKLIHSYTHINLICASLSERGVIRISEYPEVSYISLDEYCFLCGFESNLSDNFTTEINSSLTGKDINIALLDSGSFPHPTLTSLKKITDFKDLINGSMFPYDDNGHGTALSTIIAGNSVNTKNKFKGIASNSKISSYKVFDKNGKGFFSSILKALEFIIDDADSNIRILCLPFESFNTSIEHINYFDTLLENIISQGMIPIMSSGTNFNDLGILNGLANAKNIILASDIDTENIDNFPANKINIFSKNTKFKCGVTIKNYISERDGQKIYPPKVKEPFTTYSGVSVSTAYICALCALVLEKYPHYTFKDICSRIELCSTTFTPLNSRYKKAITLNIDDFLQ